MIKFDSNYLITLFNDQKISIAELGVRMNTNAGRMNIKNKHE